MDEKAIFPFRPDTHKYDDNAELSIDLFFTPDEFKEKLYYSFKSINLCRLKAIENFKKEDFVALAKELGIEVEESHQHTCSCSPGGSQTL